MQKEKILNFEVDSLNIQDCVDEIYSCICNGNSKYWLACINPHSYAEACKDLYFQKALQSSNWLIPDGAGIVLASKFFKGSIKSRITGNDIFDGLNKKFEETEGVDVFFLGSSESTLQQIEKRIKQDFSNIRVVGTYSPPFMDKFNEVELDLMRKAINKAKPQILWVGMSAPKQEKWIMDNIDYLDIKFAAAIGAVFDFYAGNIKRSNLIFQKSGLEWLPRLIQEPRRLWKRTFISAPKFLLDILKAKLQEMLT